MKVVILKPEVVDIDPDKTKITAGMVTIVPSIGGLEGLDENRQGFPPEFDENMGLDFTVAYAGQSLPRKMYQELSSEFATSGGFYEFQVPNLQRRVIMDFTDSGEPILGDVVAYYQSFPTI